MWIVIKYKKKELNFLKNEIKKKIGNDVKFYNPTLCLQQIRKNKVKSVFKPLLGDYFFCYHDKFKDIKFQNIIIYSKGLKYFLKEYLISQSEIKSFIHKCIEHEDINGFIGIDFFDLDRNKKYKFCSGPFTNFVFGLISKENNNLKCLINNFKLTVTGKHNLFYPV